MPHRKVPILLLRKIAIPAVLLVALTACGPEIQEVQVQETTEPDANDEPAESQAPTPRKVEIEVHDTELNAALMAERRRFTVITDPWSKYFRTEPTVVILPKLTEGIEGLLIEQQTKAREILSDTGQVADRPEYIHLKEQLEALKSAVPGAETRSGYGHTSRRVYVAPHSYVTPDGRSAYVRTGGTSHYYTVFRRVHKSSSPALARSIENVVYNASLEDLDQRIAALRQLHRTWSRRTNVMSPNGVEGLMREANQAYLEGIQGFTGEFVQLQGRLNRMRASVAAKSAEKEANLEAWRSFEENRLPIIRDYIVQQQEFEVAASDDYFELPAANLEDKVILLACTIGERTLYFDLSPDSYAKHPFRLIAMEE